MVVQHMRGVVALRTELLVENFLRLDVAQPIKRDTFEWLLVKGFTTWLMDGLDELYAGDPDFFDYLAELLTRPDSKTQVTIFCRDSLLTTSSEFLDFQQLVQTDKSLLRVYHLKEWERDSKRTFGWIKLEGRTPGKGEADTESVRAFMTKIEGTPAIRAMSSLPFYCNVLLDDFREGTIRDFADDVDMLESFVDTMIKREEEKGLLDLRVFESGGLREWLADIAARFFEDGYVDQTDAIEYGKIVLRDNVDENTQKNILEGLLRFPLFVTGKEGGQIAIGHDLIAEVLAASRYLHLLRGKQYDPTIATRLSRVDLKDPAILRFIARRMEPGDIQTLLELLRSGEATGHSFAVLLTLLLISRPDLRLLKESELDLEGKELGAVAFTRRDLSDVSFRRSDLTLATFEECDLRGAMFEGAFFNRTRFLGETRLDGARFGDPAKLQSLYDGTRLIEDRRRIFEWITEATGRVERRSDPCPTAMQIGGIFGKFITPLGAARRDSLNRAGLIAGKHFDGSAPVDKCIRAAISHGYLDPPDFRDRLRRAADDKYSEMVRFVRDSSVSDGIGRLIAEICERPACTHQLSPDALA
jgi:hypothetical protein